MPYLRLLVVAGLAAGCVIGPGPVEEPRLTIRGAEIVGLKGDRTSVRVVASAYNPNTFALSLRRAALELDVNGIRVGRSQEPVARTLPPRRPVSIEIVQALVIDEPGTRTMSALLRRPARYRLRGEVDVGARDRAFDVPFRHEGVLRLSDPPVVF